MAIFGHQKCSGEVSDKTGVPEDYRNPPGELMGHMGLSGERERDGQGRPRAPSPSGPNWTRRGGRRPPFLLPLPLPFPLLVGVGKRGVLLLLGGGGLLLGAPQGPAGLPPLLLYIRGQGAPLDTQVDPRDHILSCVRCPLHHNSR